jgi:putative DNA primase/helicase
MAKDAARWRLAQSADIDDADRRKKAAGWALASESRKAIEAALALARTEPGIADRGDGWDADPWLLGVENGVLDLRTGALRDGSPDDRITKHAPVMFDPDATCPTWDAFLELVQPDREIRDYLQRRAGYSLTGNTGQQDLAFLHGGGANGKSTYAVALQDVLGSDYATQAAPGLLLRHYGDRHPTEIADLDGMRLVVSTEVDDGRALAEDLVKQLTGGDRLKGRRMRQDFFAFEASFKIMLLANHKPVIRGQDLAIWRRIKQIPWNVTIPEVDRDPQFRDRLRPEAAGILNWMLAGCLDWQHHGMQEPVAVAEATAAYRAESNPVAAFLEERCALDPEGSVSASALYGAYSVWAGEQGFRGKELLSSTAFGRHMVTLFERHRGMAGAEYRGLRLRLRQDMTGSMTGFESEDRNFGISSLHTPREGSYWKNPSYPSAGEGDTREASCWHCRELLSDDSHSRCADCGWLHCYCGTCSPECVGSAR